jgi:hypothetical protein
MKNARRALGAIAVLAVALSCAASAQAARITIGSPITGVFSPSTCGAPCTIIATESQSAGAVLVSPVNGVILAWHLREGSPTNKYALRVSTPAGGNVFTPGSEDVFTGAGTSVAVNPVGAGFETFPTALPVHVGQMIGINLEAGAPIGFNPSAGSYAYYGLPLADGATTAAPILPGELAFNAEIQPAPTITLLSTTSGPTAGGTSVTIAGANFAEVKSVNFGSTAAPFLVNSESQITTTAPAASAGSVPVTVTTSGGTGTASQQFAYTAPAAPPAPAPPATIVCKVPNLQGKKLKGAKKAAVAAHCKVGKVTKKDGVTAKTGKVVKQGAKAGTVKAAGSKVSVKLG